MNLSLLNHAGYREADEKLQGLKLREQQLASNEREMASAFSRRNTIQDEATALLHDSPVSTEVVTRSELDKCRHDQRVVAEAIEMQKRVVEKERYAAGAMLCDQARPAYRAIIKRMAAILESLREAAVEENTLRRDLIGAGASLTNEFINPFCNCGLPESDGVRNDPVDRWIRDAKQAGAL